jgi:hypothetical protein
MGTELQTVLARDGLTGRQSPPAPAVEKPADDLIKRIAMDIGKQVVAYIEHAYPAMFEAVASDSAKLSVRNATYNAIIAAGEAFGEGLSEQRLAEHAKQRRVLRKLRKAAAEAGTKPAEETLREIAEAIR